jgi:hypothetical protein
MPTASKVILAVLVGCTLTVYFTVPTAAGVKDHRKHCGTSTTSNMQACGKQVSKAPGKIPAKKPGKDGDKGISPGALLLLQLLL